MVKKSFIYLFAGVMFLCSCSHPEMPLSMTPQTDSVSRAVTDWLLKSDLTRAMQVVDSADAAGLLSEFDAEMFRLRIISRDEGNILGGGSFSTTLGNFTKIEVYAGVVTTPLGEGWSGNSERQTWTGNASSVSFSGNIMSEGEEVNLMFTIEPASTPEPEPQGETITVTWNSYDLPSSGSSFTKDGVTLTCTIDDDLYGPGTFTTNLGNFTQIVVSGEEACYIDATDGWSGNINQKTWTGNAASVSWGGSIYSFSYDVTFVFTIEPSGTATAVENVQTNHVQATKFFRDGMLLIEKNGKIYNATGAEVK